MCHMSRARVRSQATWKRVALLLMPEIYRHTVSGVKPWYTRPTPKASWCTSVLLPPIHSTVHPVVLTATLQVMDLHFKRGQVGPVTEREWETMPHKEIVDLGGLGVGQTAHYIAREGKVGSYGQPGHHR